MKPRASPRATKHERGGEGRPLLDGPATKRSEGERQGDGYQKDRGERSSCAGRLVERDDRQQSPEAEQAGLPSPDRTE
jgi:hypothetical protein